MLCDVASYFRFIELAISVLRHLHFNRLGYNNLNPMFVFDVFGFEARMRSPAPERKDQMVFLCHLVYELIAQVARREEA
jgi:hypothetical protein